MVCLLLLLKKIEYGRSGFCVFGLRVGYARRVRYRERGDGRSSMLRVRQWNHRCHARNNSISLGQQYRG